METQLAQKAISAALESSWEEALKINLQILKENPKDIDALNRIAKACAELGKIPQARGYSQKVLKIDPLNAIATKSLEKWRCLKKGVKGTLPATLGEGFLEEPGKTKLVSLLNPGDASILAQLDCGDEVTLSPHAHRVCINTLDGKYVGRLPDDLAARLRRLIKMGNLYRVLIKSIEGKEIKVFIRETQRSSRTGSTLSFPPEKIEYISFTPPELVHGRQESAAVVSSEDSEE